MGLSWLVPGAGPRSCVLSLGSPYGFLACPLRSPGPRRGLGDLLLRQPVRPREWACTLVFRAQTSGWRPSRKHPSFRPSFRTRQCVHLRRVRSLHLLCRCRALRPRRLFAPLRRLPTRAVPQQSCASQRRGQCCGIARRRVSRRRCVLLQYASPSRRTCWNTSARKRGAQPAPMSSPL